MILFPFFFLFNRLIGHQYNKHGPCHMLERGSVAVFRFLALFGEGG